MWYIMKLLMVTVNKKSLYTVLEEHNAANRLSIFKFLVWWSLKKLYFYKLSLSSF